MHVVVVGGGIFGQVIAWRLTKAGARVSLIEPVGPGHATSASGDRSRLVRALYDEPSFAASGHRSLALWREWQAELGAKLIESIGVLYLVRRREHASAAWDTWVRKGERNLEELGAPTVKLTPRELGQRYPAIAADTVEYAVVEPGGGFGRPALAARTFSRAANATGLVTHITAKATRVIEEGGRAVGVATDAGEVRGDAIVIAAGYHGAALIEPFTGALPVRWLPHWTTYWDVPMPEGADLMNDRLPGWVDLGSRIYGFPDDGEAGFKCAWHEPRKTDHDGGDPTKPAPPPSIEDAEALRAHVATLFPAMKRATLRGHFACAYDATPDENFLVGPVPNVRSLFFVGGLSGHGFKHAPSIGDAVAKLAMDAEPCFDLLAFRLPAASTP
jgi:glycine/D-amino acid oxidase-like deaminating enzyme